MQDDKHKPGDKEIARWLKGELTDPREIRRLQQAIARDPKLQRMLEILGPDVPDEIDFGEATAELRLLVSDVSGSVRAARLFAMELEPSDIGKVFSGGELVGRGFGVMATNQTLEFGFRLRPHATRSSDIEASFDNLPTGIKPVNITVADFGLNAKIRPVPAKRILEPGWPREMLDAWNAARVERAPSTFLPEHGGVDLVGLADGNPGNRSFRFRHLTGSNRLNLECDSDANRDFELAVVEEIYPGQPPIHRQRARVLTRYPGSSLDRDFILDGYELQLPIEATNIDEVDITVRAGGARELQLLDSDDVMIALANCDPRCFPLMPEGDSWWLRFLPSEREALQSKQLTWALAVNLSETNTEGRNHVSF